MEPLQGSINGNCGMGRRFFTSLKTEQGEANSFLDFGTKITVVKAHAAAHALRNTRVELVRPSSLAPKVLLWHCKLE